MATNFEGREILDDDELKAEFAALFPHGWGGADVLAELAPDGWEAAPLSVVFNPSAEQRLKEALAMRRGFEMLSRRPDAPPPPPDPTLADFETTEEPAPAEPERECRELVGMGLWDIFSDNHEVTAADGRLLDLGTQRSAGGFLAEVLNGQGGPPAPAKLPPPPELMAMMTKTDGSPQAEAFMKEMMKEMFGDGGYTYIDFYLGTRMVSGRADLTPLYEMIFRRLRARGLDWEYHFPRLHLVDFRGAKKAMDAADRDEPEWAGYDPAAAMAEEEEDREHDAKVAAMREELDEGNREAIEAAREAEPPAVVRAYAAVYGEFPAGWPPE